MLRAVLIVGLIVITAAMFLGKGDHGSQSTGAGICPGITGKSLKPWMDAGVVVKMGNDRVTVEDRAWEQITHDAKVSIALIYFCNQYPDGSGFIRVIGNRDGETRAKVQNGNYFRG